jgi:small-conductance mechanosensitive channel
MPDTKTLISLVLFVLGAYLVLRGVFFVLRRSFRGAAWLLGFERGFTLFVVLVVGLHLSGWLPDLIAWLESVRFGVGKQQLDLWQILRGLATVLATVLLALWLGGLLESRLLAAQALDSSLRVVLARLARALFLVVAVLIALPAVGIDLTMLSVFGGAFGVGLGFGLQKIAANYVSGFIILLDRSIRLGDQISVGQDRGQVTQITTRYTVLKGSNGVESIVPNEVLVSSVVQNESYSDTRVRHAVSVQVGYDCDLDAARALLLTAAASEPRVLAEPAPQAFVMSFADSGIVLELAYWLGDPAGSVQTVRSTINLAIWRAFKAAGMVMPYPQREVRILRRSDAD